MGADLYIEKLLPRDFKGTGFRTNIKAGYFWDAYNYGNLIWQFGLSYWKDVAEKFMTKDGRMSVMKAEDLLKELKKREPIFEKNMDDLLGGKNVVYDFETRGKKRIHRPHPDLKEKDREKLVASYRKSYRQMQVFLRKAIEMKSTILCSV